MSTVRLKTACAVIFLQLDIDFGCMLLESFQQDSEDPEGLPTSPKNLTAPHAPAGREHSHNATSIDRLGKGSGGAFRLSRC